MKRLIFLLILFIMLFSACSCAAPNAFVVEPEPTPDLKATPEPASEPTLVPTLEPAHQPTPEPSSMPTLEATDEKVYEIVDLYGTEDGTMIETLNMEEIASRIIRADDINIDEPLDIKTYNETKLLFEHFHVFDIGIDSGYYNFTPNSRPDFLDYMLTVFPDAAWRKMNTGFNYAVLDGDEGSRVFLFYPQHISNSVTLLGYPIVMKNKLSYNDFSEIKISDTSDKVNAIDPITENYTHNYDACNDFAIDFMLDRGNKMVSVHLLTDGILKYTYERSGEEGNYVYTIVDIEYHENFKMEGLGGVTDYSIAEIDYVD